MPPGSVPVDGDATTVRVQMTFRYRVGSKQVLAPDGAAWTPPRVRIDNIPDRGRNLVTKIYTALI